MVSLAKEFCLIARCNSRFLEFKPSLIAASSLVWAFNVIRAKGEKIEKELLVYNNL